MKVDHSYVADFIICLLFTLIATYSLWLLPGLPASWDFGIHLATIAKLRYWLVRGVFPLEFLEWWMGFPMLTFYPPLFYLSSAIMGIILNIETYEATKGVLLILSFFTCFNMYYICRRIFHSRQGALVAGVAYLFAGYRLYNMFAIGNYPATYAFLLAPIVFGCHHLFLQEGKIRYEIYSGIALAACILSHLLTAYLMLLFFAMLTIIEMFVNLISRRWKTLLRNFAGFIVVVSVSLSLSLWFIVPMWNYRPYTAMYNWKTYYGQSMYVIDPEHLIMRSPPLVELFIRRPVDFLGSTPLYGTTYPPNYIGNVIFILGIVGTYFILRKCYRSFGELVNNFNRGKEERFVILSLVLLVLTTIFLGKVEWYLQFFKVLGPFFVESLSSVGFTNRVTFLICYSASVLAGFFVSKLTASSKLNEIAKRTADKYNIGFSLVKTITLLLCILMIFDTIPYAQSPFFYNASYPPYGSPGVDHTFRWVSDQEGFFRIWDPLCGTHGHLQSWDKAMFAESYPVDLVYMPYSEGTRTTAERLYNMVLDLPLSRSNQSAKFIGYLGVKYAIGHLGDYRIDSAAFENVTSWSPWIAHKQFGEVWVFRNPYFRDIVEVVNSTDSLEPTVLGEASITLFNPNHFVVQVNAREDAFLIFKFFNFPAWSCFVDGIQQEIGENYWGLVYVPIHKGSHVVEFYYRKDEYVPMVISMVSLIVVVASLIVIRKREKTRRNHIS